jgi:hypothetical protein
MHGSQYQRKNFVAALRVIVLVGALYYFVARPYQLTLGAIPTEIEWAMPGDELDPAPHFLATRAITIRGTPEEIWPWLIQMSYNRAGFYAYDILENIGSERGLRSAEEIIPEFQHFDMKLFVKKLRLTGDEYLFASISSGGTGCNAFGSINGIVRKKGLRLIWAGSKTKENPKNKVSFGFKLVRIRR